MKKLFTSFINVQFSTDDFTNFLNKYESKKYKTKFDGMWKHYHIIGEHLPQSGWKGHISAMPEDKESIFKIAFKILVQEECEFKVARSKKVYQALADPHAPVDEANKFITFYPKNNEKFRRIVKRLFHALRYFSSPSIYTDYQLSKNNPVQFRYGAFKEMKKWDTNKKEYIQLMKLPSGKIVEDNRENIFSIPEGVILPFVEADKEWVEEAESPDSKKLDKYSFEEILSQKNKGDVYLGTLAGKKIVLKSANPFVKNRSSYRSAHQLLENEIKYLIYLNNTNIVPKLFDTFTVENEKFEAISYIDGISLDSPIAKEKAEEIVISLCKTVYQFHSRDLVITDLTNNNFIYNSNGSCYLVDLEYVQNKNELHPREGYTPYYIPIQNKESIPTQKEDIFSLAITILGISFKTLPKYKSTSLKGAVRELKKQIFIQKRLNPNNKKLLDIASYLLDISVSKSMYDPSVLLNINNIPKNLKKSSLYSNQEICMLLQYQENNWKKIFLQTKFKNGLRIKNWSTTKFSDVTSQVSIQNGVLGVTRALDIIPWENMKDIGEIISTNRSYIYSESYLFGSSSIIWEILYEYENNLVVYSSLKKVVNQVIKSWNNKDQEIDFALGISGKLYTLIYALLIEPRLSFLNKIALNLYNQLKQKLSEDTDRYNLKSVSFAHGLSGEAYVLLISAIYFEDKIGIKKAITHLEYIDKIVENWMQHNSEYVNYMELSWCEGISGIATALLRSQYILNGWITFDSLKYALKYLLKNYSILESNLCHGKESIIGYLNDVAIRYESKLVNKYLNLLINFEISTGEDETAKELDFFDETGYTHNIDYGTGQVGVVDTCLRAIKHKDRLFYLSAKQEKKLSKKLKHLIIA